MAESFLIFSGGNHDPAWVYTDVPVSQSLAIEMIASGEPRDLNKVVGFDLEHGRTWDATADVMAGVLEKLSGEGEPLSYGLWSTVERFAGHGVARCFEMEEA